MGAVDDSSFNVANCIQYDGAIFLLFRVRYTVVIAIMYCTHLNKHKYAYNISVLKVIYLQLIGEVICPLRECRLSGQCQGNLLSSEAMPSQKSCQVSSKMYEYGRDVK